MPDQSTKEVFKSIQILYFALITGPVVLLAVATYLKNTGFEPVDEDTSNLFTLISILYAPIAIGASYFVYKLKVKKIDPSYPLFQKMFEYRFVYVLRLAILEGGVMLITVFYLLTGNFLLLFLAIALLLFMWWYRPSISLISKDLSFTIEEENELRSIL